MNTVIKTDVTIVSGFSSKEELRDVLVRYITEDGILPEDNVRAYFKDVETKKVFPNGPSYENVHFYEITLGDSAQKVYYWDEDDLYPLSNKESRNAIVCIKTSCFKGI